MVGPSVPDRKQESEVTLGNTQLFGQNPNDQFRKAEVSEKEVDPALQLWGSNGG